MKEKSKKRTPIWKKIKKVAVNFNKDITTK